MAHAPMGAHMWDFRALSRKAPGQGKASIVRKSGVKPFEAGSIYVITYCFIFRKRNAAFFPFYWQLWKMEVVINQINMMKLKCVY